MTSVVSSVPVLVGLPVAILGIVAQFSPTAALLIKKFFNYTKAVSHMILTTEGGAKKLIKKMPDPDTLTSSADKYQKVELIFIRHGESTWNEVFNKGKGVSKFVQLPFRFILAFIREALCAFSELSVFLDSPLSPEGIDQAKKLQKFLANPANSSNKYVPILLGKSGSSVMVSSNLQRCLETVAIGLGDRLTEKKDKIVVMSELQEMARNVDTFSLSDPSGLPPLVQLRADGLQLDAAFDSKKNQGQKQMFVSGMERLKSFAAWCFEGEEVKGGNKTLIISGHSLYFKTFFQAYMGRSKKHPAKEKKIANGGAVALTLERGVVDGNLVYKVDPESISIIHGAFE